MIQYNVDITISMQRASIFSNDMAMINIGIIADQYF